MEKLAVPGLPLFVPDALNENELEALLLRFRIDEIGYKLAHNLIDADLRARSPSPNPEYDALGKRTNTREQRAKEKLIAERQRLVERAKRLLPSSPPADYRPLSTTSTRKIYIPIKEYPDYKFIGLILGPRGSMQKEMERVTGAKIAIRGRGSRPEGRRAHPSGADEDDELHVLLTATSQEALDHAESLVSRLLVPVEEGLNEIKMRQLRKLAEMAGTLRDTNYGLELHFKENRPDGFSRSTPLPSPPRPPQFVTQAYYDLMTTLGEDTNNIQVQESTAHIAHQKDEEGYLSFLSSVGIETSSLGGNAFSSSTAASSPDLELHTEHQLPAPWDL